MSLRKILLVIQIAVSTLIVFPYQADACHRLRLRKCRCRCTATEKSELGKKIERLIEQLASQNPLPAFDGRGNLSKAFSLKKQRIVEGTYLKLLSIGEPAIPYLVKYVDDERFSHTAYSSLPGLYPSPKSVGYACRQIINELVAPDENPKNIRDDASGKFHWIEPYFQDDENISKWWRENSGKRLYEIQIQAVEWQLEQEQKVDYKTEAEKRRIIEPLKQKLKLLQSTKKPLPHDYSNRSVEALLSFPFLHLSESNESDCGGKEENDSDKRAALAARVKGNEKHNDINAILEKLKDHSPTVRYETIYQIREIGPLDARKAIPTLLDLLKDEDSKVRSSAALALGEIGPPTKTVVPGLIDALKDEDKSVRWNVARALGAIGSAAEESVPALTKVLKDKNRTVRNNAADALGEIGPAAKQAVPALTKKLKNEKKWDRAVAARALGKIGPSSKEAIPALIDALKDDFDPLRVKAALAIWRGLPLSCRSKRKTDCSVRRRRFLCEGSQTSAFNS